MLCLLKLSQYSVFFLDEIMDPEWIGLVDFCLYIILYKLIVPNYHDL
jgi:hypothetical protein